MNGTLSQTDLRQCVRKNLNNDLHRGKIKVKKNLENAMKGKVSVRANVSWPSLKKTFKKWRQTKNID